MATSAAISLATRSTGVGPPIVLVHGTACDGQSFRLLERWLVDHFTVITVDRRGRGDSADREAYTLEAEFDDIAQVIDDLTEPAVLFGHSFGANVALGASLRTANIKALVLYEPGRPRDARAEIRHELEDLVSRNERAAAMRLVLREFDLFPEEWLDELLATAPWQERLAYVETVIRELDAYVDYDYGGLSQLDIPTLLVAGSESAPEDVAFVRSLAARLPSAVVSVLQGEGHIAATTSPALLADVIVSFVRGCDTTAQMT